MGKLTIPANVNLQTATIGECLKQIKHTNNKNQESENPETIEVWVCDISPQQTKSIVNFIEGFLKSIDTFDYSHVKRFKKVIIEGTTYISSILCSTRAVGDRSFMLKLLNGEFDSKLQDDRLRRYEIPIELPQSKEVALKWSELYWPLSWKGNPNHQYLAATLFDIEDERRIINILIDQARMIKKTVTIIAEKVTDSSAIKILHLAHDESDKNILQHSIMSAISEIARAELLSRSSTTGGSSQGYLCHKLLVYTTHEPCTMCAMALVHSRIGQLVYIWDHPLGAIESSHYIGDRNDLNWTFNVWRWVGCESIKELDWATEVIP